MGKERKGMKTYDRHEGGAGESVTYWIEVSRASSPLGWQKTEGGHADGILDGDVDLFIFHQPPRYKIYIPSIP